MLSRPGFKKLYIRIYPNESIFCPKVIGPIHKVDGALRFLRALHALSNETEAEAAQLKLDLLGKLLPHQQQQHIFERKKS